jgi:AraC-like DNA-binding protein
MDKGDEILYNTDMVDRVHIISAGMDRGDSNWIWDSDEREENWFIFWLILEGRGHLDLRGNRYELKSGDCFVSSLRDRHSARQAPPDLLRIAWAVFEYHDARGGIIDPSSPPALHRAIDQPAFVQSLFERLYEAMKSTPPNRDWASKWLEALLLEIARQDSKPDFTGPELEYYDRLQWIRVQIDMDPSRDWDTAAMAKRAHCSADHFMRLFKRFFGVTPRELILRRRTEEARHLLRFSGHSVGRIAEILGYANVYYFSRQFKARVGRSPSAYRRGD